MLQANLTFFEYKLFDYEKALAEREVEKLFHPASISKTSNGLEISVEGIDWANVLNLANNLTYFRSLSIQGETYELAQSKREKNFSDKSAPKRQNTRYGIHGLHEYKGKFNPQIASAMLNILEISGSKRVLDPFCGSGTLLVEAQNKGINALGMDINPAATFIANAKLFFQSMTARGLDKKISFTEEEIENYKRKREAGAPHPHNDYLSKWFDASELNDITFLFNITKKISNSKYRGFIRCCISNLLRDYSQQDPRDLRIRRRKSQLPEKPLFNELLDTLKFYRLVRFNLPKSNCASETRAIVSDSAKPWGGKLDLFDGAITSPPYATALPYIDTNRLSLVWLNLTPPDRLQTTEKSLIGSREFTKSQINKIYSELASNFGGIPGNLIQLCMDMQSALTETDGFRRQATPALIYKYFSDMLKMFINCKGLIKEGAAFGLIVGHNKTSLGGIKFNIDTPKYLIDLAVHAGWRFEENFEIEAFKRFSLHSANSSSRENLILLRR